MWNSFVIAVFIKDRHLLQAPSSLFLFILAVVDLLLTVLSIPFYVAAIIAGGWVIGSTDSIREGTCIAVGFIFSVFLFTTVHLLAVISFDRFLYIVHPLQYRKWMSVSRAICLAVVVSFIPIVLACLPFFGFGRLGYSPFIGACLFRWEGERPYVITIAVEALIPIVATVIFTLWTYIHAKRFLRRRHIRQKSIDTSTIRNQSAERMLTRTFALLLVSQAVCFTPGILTAIVGFFIGYRNVPNALLITDLLIIVSSVAINPIIQSLSRTQIRQYLTSLFSICQRSKLVPTVEPSIESNAQSNRTINVHPFTSQSTMSDGDNEATCKPDHLTLNYDVDPINGTLV